MITASTWILITLGWLAPLPIGEGLPAEESAVSSVYPSGLLAGNVTNTTPRGYSVAVLFGVEQLENKVVSKSRRELWYLACINSPLSGNPSPTYCNLERTVFDDLSVSRHLKTMISVQRHSTSNGTLIINKADWIGGNLSFAVLHPDKSRTEVLMKLATEKDSLFIRSFKGIGVRVGPLTSKLQSVEYRIPEHTYTVDIPVVMPGLKSDEEKTLEAMFATFSSADLAVWNRVRRDPSQPVLWDESRVKRALGEARQRLTNADMRKVYEVFLGDYRQWLSKTGLSGEFVKQIAAFLSQSEENLFLLLAR